MRFDLSSRSMLKHLSLKSSLVSERFSFCGSVSAAAEGSELIKFLDLVDVLAVSSLFICSFASRLEINTSRIIKFSEVSTLFRGFGIVAESFLTLLGGRSKHCGF